MDKRPDPGEAMPRSELHAMYGGNRQSGISISAQAGMIHLFSDPIHVESYGMPDGLDEEGIYLYTGAGQKGDQTLTQGNRALLTHKDANRDVYIWRRERQGDYRCVGQFEVDQEQPFISTDAFDADGELRTVIVFRLRPVGELAADAPVVTTTEALAYRGYEEKAAIGGRVRIERLQRRSSRDSEMDLAIRYRAHLERLGHEIRRVQILPPGEVRPFCADLHDRTDNVLIECKASPTRQALRLAIGQLIDYRRFFSPTPRLAVLTGSKPRQDLIDLCSSMTIEVIWLEEDGTFTSSFD
ncbi:restriction endonuclease [Streptomyces sp. CB01881]|uniref:restriction endonuclease n=1 Tax=Streptomyces sp. CB01881 TaxID=2078691 RepID=UPI000CDC16EF|nr:restriction endonuclease [Streptomyces sp. CB01881]AUY49246.1 restriction endonuclease [Streptomyces sp. CB01881]TYC72638.1 restriction endonuclease [Streptomyces sp. CB01881]